MTSSTIKGDVILKKRKVAIIGAGAVGATTAFTLMLKNRVDELVLIDANHDMAVGNALDINHSLPFLSKAKVWAGTYEDCVGCDIIIVSAGAAQKPGETRIDLLKKNKRIINSIIDSITEYTTEGILLIASNPVDIMSYFAWQQSKWPANRVIGSGTLLDSARFRYLISEKLNIRPNNIHAYIIGEHGDSELPVWSLANVSGSRIELSDAEREEVFTGARDAAYKIIETKGATYYAIAVAIDRICCAILKDEGSILAVSTLLDNYHGISDVYLGVPCIIDASGIREVLPLDLNKTEIEQLQHSASKLKESIKQTVEM